MATRPTTEPTWADGASATKTNPGVVKRALGWVFREKPAFDHFNWLLNLIGQWVSWLSAHGTIAQYETMAELVSDTAVGRASLLVSQPDDPYKKLWSKSDTQLGATGVAILHVATDAERAYIVTSQTAGFDQWIRAYDLDSGVEDWSRLENGAVTTIDFACNGRHLFWLFSQGGSEYVFVYNLDGTSAINSINVNGAVTLASDGILLYVATATTVYCYSDYDTTEVLDWSASPSTGGNIVSLATNGHLLWVGQVFSAPTSLTIYDRLGNFVGSDDPESGTSYDCVELLVTDNYLYFLDSNEALYLYPAGLQIPVGGSIPGVFQSSQLVPVFKVGDLSGLNFGESIPCMSDEYLVGIDGLGAPNSVVFCGRTTEGAEHFVPSFWDQWDTGLVDAAISPKHLVYGGEENGNGEALVCRLLPPRGKLLLRVDPETDRYRAPLFSTVKEVPR